MKTLNIQIHPGRDNSLDERFVVETIEALNLPLEIEEGEDNGRYINFNICTSNVTSTWEKLKHKLLKNVSVANTAIICVEGDNGWSDYLLLHHYDKDEILDEIRKGDGGG